MKETAQKFLSDNVLRHVSYFYNDIARIEEIIATYTAMNIAMVEKRAMIKLHCSLQFILNELNWVSSLGGMG